MRNTEKAAYIRGLLAGLELDPDAKETKVFNAITELLEEMSLEVETLKDMLGEFAEIVDNIDEDLGELERDFYEIDDDIAHGDVGEMDDEMAFFEVTCPTCGDSIELNEDMLDELFIFCPNCNEKLEFDFDDECECGCEECGHDHDQN